MGSACPVGLVVIVALVIGGCALRMDVALLLAMVRSLDPVLLRYLQRVQSCSTPGLHYAARVGDRAERTIYRWRATLQNAIVVFPTFTVEALGLCHAHVFASGDWDRWGRCSYGVESAWVGRGLTDRLLYVHCLVPDEHREHFSSHAGDATIIWSSSGWQSFLPDTFSLPTTTGVVASILTSLPLAVPVVLEGWGVQRSMHSLWVHIKARLDGSLRRLVGKRLYPVNGKSHVQQTYHALTTAGLFRQTVIRHHPLLRANVEVFAHCIGSRDEATAFLTSLGSVLRCVDAYPTNDGYFLRLLVHPAGLESISDHPDRERLSIAFVCRSHLEAPRVRFAYESLFDPVSRSWQLP